ncbi:hypothetical protein BGZ81_010060 [Podila clonocystis]|nr:hypothetical protein BGZ81_010060 [Podila clonocystis]
MTHSFSIFEIPHIHNSICDYLSLHHLTICVRVNKSWFNHFLPVLYRSLYVEVEYLVPSGKIVTSAVLNSLSPTTLALVQTLKTELVTEHSWVNSNDFPVLRDLDLHWYLTDPGDTELSLPIVMSFLHERPAMRHFGLSLQSVSQETFQCITDTIAEHPGLQSVSLMLNLALPVRFDCVFRSMLKLRSFKLDIWGPHLFDAEDPRSKECIQSISQLPISNIRNLELSVCNQSMEQALLPALMAKCPLLETLEMPLLQTPPGAMDAMVAKVRGACPRLRHLKFKTFYQFDNPALLKMCTRGLEALEIEHPSLPLFSVLQAIVPFHSQTLTSLIFHRKLGVDPETMLDLLYFCPFLLHVEVGVILNARPHGVTECGTVALSKRFQQAWTSTRLRTLLIAFSWTDVQISQEGGLESGTFSKGEVNRMEVGDGSLIDRFLSHLLTQIGRLLCLRELHIEGLLTTVFTLEGGYLEKLGGLRQMRTLSTRYLRDLSMTENEALWILQHWPVIAEVRGFRCVSERFRTLLQDARPGLIVN